MVSQEILQRAVADYFAANNTLDVERFVDSFTEDATIYYAGPVSPISGPAGIRQVAEQSLTPFSKMQATITRIFFVENGVAVLYTVHLTARNGRSATTDGLDVMEITSEGKIRSLRLYQDIEPILTLF